jgi:hypothetical protein
VTPSNIAVPSLETQRDRVPRRCSWSLKAAGTPQPEPSRTRGRSHSRSWSFAVAFTIGPGGFTMAPVMYRERITCGCRAARCSATAPPRESPTTSTAVVIRSAARRSARWSTTAGRPGQTSWACAPNPGRSGVTTSRSLSTSTWAATSSWRRCRHAEVAREEHPTERSAGGSPRSLSRQLLLQCGEPVQLRTHVGDAVVQRGRAEKALRSG